MIYEIISIKNNGIDETRVGKHVYLLEVLHKPNYIESFWKASKVELYTEYDYDWVNIKTGKKVSYMNKLHDLLSESVVAHKLNRNHE